MDPRSRFTRAATCTAFCLVIAAAALSCRANPVSKTRLAGPATLELAVGGVVPPTPSRSPRAARSVPGISPAILPNTATIRVVVEDEDGDRTTVSSAYTGAGTVSVGDLPAEEELTIEVAALNAAGEVVTSWTGTVELEEGQNALTATLAPPASAVTALPTTTVSLGGVTLASSVNLGAGGVAFYRIPLDCAAGGEYQIIYDTGKARWAWMGAYGDSWLPLQVVCSDQAQGWAVVSVPAGVATTVNIALSNSVSSPGYPAGSMTGALQARHAVFVVPGGTGTGTSGSPDGDFSALTDGESIFVSAGNYTLSDTLSIFSDVRMYGGFASGWGNRTGTTFIALSAETSTTMEFGAGSSGLLDRLTIHGNEWAAGMGTSISLALSPTSAFVVNGCAIEGNAGATGSSTNYSSYALEIDAGTPEIASCSILGGTVVTSTAQAQTTAVLIYGGTPYLHHCSIDGGTTSVSSVSYNANSFGVHINEAGLAVVADCRIWGGAAFSAIGTGQSIGVYCVSTVGGSVIANSIISGGYASTDSSLAYPFGIYKNENDALIAGCTIDSGINGTTGDRAAYAVHLNSSDVADGTLAANAIFCSTASGGVVAAIYDFNPSDGEIVTGNGLFSYIDQVYTWGESSETISYLESGAGFPDYYSGNAAPSGVAPAAEFRSYSAAPTTFAQFLAADWRPASGAAIVGTASGGSPQSVGVDPSLFTTYPALGFDLAGNARGYNTVWNRGAYQ